MATMDQGIQLSFLRDGMSFNRTYHQSEAVQNVIILGRLSSTASDSRLPSWSENQREVGGYIVSPGKAAFVSPVMSRQHARLVFSGNEICIYDTSHHGTYVSRSGSTFRVDHGQILQSGDVITFGKTVHRRGQVYEPLSARVKIISADPTYQAFASYTGHGYSLPPNIDVDPELDEDHDVYIDDELEEDPSTHKFYSVQEVQEDDGGDRESIASPIFPRGVDLKHDPLSSMPGGYHALPEASFVGFSAPSQTGFFGLLPPIQGYSSTSPLAQSHPISLIPGDDHSSLSVLAPILGHGPPLLSPLLPPITAPCVRPAVPLPSQSEIINVDGIENEVIDVDAIGSPDSSVREISPYNWSDAESGRSLQSPSSTPSFLPRQKSSEEAGNLREVLKTVQALATKLDELLSDRSQSLQRNAANKAHLETEIEGLKQDVTLLKGKVDLMQGSSSEIGKHTKEALEDIDLKKSAFLNDLNIYEDDVVYEVDTLMNRIDELNIRVGEGNETLDSFVESVKKLDEEAQLAVRAQIDKLKATATAAAEQIHEVVAGVKRKRDEGDGVDEPSTRTRSPSVAMSMSPEPEACSRIHNTSLNSIEIPVLPNVQVSESHLADEAPRLSFEPPRKRQRLEETDTGLPRGPRAGRLAGLLVGTTVAICWALGKIGEMSTSTDI